MTPFDLDALPNRFDDAETIDTALAMMLLAGFDRRTMELVLVRRAPVDLDLLAERLARLPPETQSFTVLDEAPRRRSRR